MALSVLGIDVCQMPSRTHSSTMRMSGRESRRRISLASPRIRPDRTKRRFCLEAAGVDHPQHHLAVDVGDHQIRREVDGLLGLALNDEDAGRELVQPHIAPAVRAAED